MRRIWGDLFDLNRDGHTDLFERAAGLALLDEQERQAREAQKQGEDREGGAWNGNREV